MEKYTIIHQCGQEVIKYSRIETNDLWEFIFNDPVFSVSSVWMIFVGWPKLEGEK